MEGQRFIKDQRVETPDGPGKVDGYGYPPGVNKAPTSIWVYLDSGNFRGFSLDAGVRAEPGAPEPTPLELAVFTLLDSMRMQASMMNDGVYYVSNLSEVDTPNFAQFRDANSLAVAAGQPPIWTFEVYRDDDDESNDAD